MATNAEQSQLKQATADQQAAPTTGAGTNAAPQAGRVASYSSGAAPSVQQGSGRYTNLKKYVNANQGAGEQLGSKITNDIDKNVQKTNKEATSAAGNVANAVNAEKDRLAQGSQFNQQLQAQDTDGASAIYNDQNQRDQFGRLLTNQGVASNLQTQAQTAADQAASGFNSVNQQVNNLGTEQGRFQLLQQSVKNPGYTQGAQRLDQLMLQAGNPQQLVQQGRGLQNQINTYGKDLTNQFTNLGGQIGQVGTQADEVSKLLSGTLGTQTQNLTQAQIAEAQALNTKNSGLNTALQNYFTNGAAAINDPSQVSAIEQMLAGGNLKAGTSTYKTLSDGKYNNYLNLGSTNLGASDVLDQNEYNRYNSLFNLGGAQGPAAFTGAGSGGQQAGVKAEQLSKDIQAARDALYGQLSTDKQAQGYGTGQQGKYAADSIYSENTVTNQANLQNLFNQTEAGTAADSLSGINNINNNGRFYGQNGVSGYFNGAGPAPTQWAAVNDATNMANSDARQKILNDYLSQLAQAGYNNKLGG